MSSPALMMNPACDVDPDRLSCLQSHLSQVLRARVDGLMVDGYFVWTFTDNFEWAEGYYPRFGLVYLDFNNWERTVKPSGKWYVNFLSQEHGIKPRSM